MTNFAIFVTIKLKPDCLDAYLPLIHVDASSALRDEPGCLLFHILRPEIGKEESGEKEGGDVLHLYEVYESEEAFKAHQQSPHFTHYIKETEALVEERIIQRLDVIPSI